MKNYKMAIYPYSEEVSPILEHIHYLNPQYKINALISPKGWGYFNKTVELNNSDPKISITILSSLYEMAEDTNCIFIPEFDATKQFEAEMIDNINLVISRISKIICAAFLKKENLEKLKKICLDTNGKCELEIKNEIKTKNDANLEIDEEYSSHLEDIPIPIIVIAGMWENTDKFYVSLALRNMFLNDGYKVSQIGSRNYCEMLGFHSFPKFMQNSGIDEAKKVILFNRYIKKLYDFEKPDIIIISIPGASQSFNSKITNRFGILHYLVFKAVIVDFLLMCTFFVNNSIEFLNIISQSCKYKFGCPADCFHMSNLSINFSDFELLYDAKEMSFLTLPRQKVCEAISEYYKNSPISVVNVYDKTNMVGLYNQIINKLSVNTTINIIS